MRKTVLVVDDEKDLVELLAAVLRKRGFHVREAVGSAEAIAICEDSKTALDLILSDFQMPGTMNGLELIDRVICTRPEISVILMSSSFSGVDAIIARGFQFIEKPFSLDDLVFRIKELLFLKNPCIDGRRERSKVSLG